jgi:hypothetical protein
LRMGRQCQHDHQYGNYYLFTRKHHQSVLTTKLYIPLKNTTIKEEK